MRAAAVVDLDVLRRNVIRATEVATAAEVMVVVKADGYGHGMLGAARAARAGGASWLGVALPAEALALRAGGDTGRILAWVTVPGDVDLAGCVAADIDVSAGTCWGLDDLAAAARSVGRPARVHLKVDTGLGRGGASAAEWGQLVARAADLAAEGIVQVAGLWSHLAMADIPGHPVTAGQRDAFDAAVRLARQAGLDDTLLHLASSGAVWGEPSTHYDLVRVGIAAYGLSPGDRLGTPADLGVVPAMTLLARVAQTKRVPAGHGVSYGHTFVTDRATSLALVPLGYADGLPRAASGRGELLLGGRRRTVAGRVAMDQLVVDVGDDEVRAGDTVVVFGPGDQGEPTAADWARACHTIGYEIVTRVGARVPRLPVGAL
ncbi:MAG: alanine racemase [Actinomycetota bacterium]|nr:MAG: alanine racemase [Actinomycetota bacterium]